MKPGRSFKQKKKIVLFQKVDSPATFFECGSVKGQALPSGLG